MTNDIPSKLGAALDAVDAFEVGTKDAFDFTAASETVEKLPPQPLPPAFHLQALNDYFAEKDVAPENRKHDSSLHETEAAKKGDLSGCPHCAAILAIQGLSESIRVLPRTAVDAASPADAGIVQAQVFEDTSVTEVPPTMEALLRTGVGPSAVQE